MGCSSSKQNPVVTIPQSQQQVLQSVATEEPRDTNPKDTSTKDVKLNETKQKDTKPKESKAKPSTPTSTTSTPIPHNDKENRINLVFRVKRQNVFNHGYDLTQYSCTTNGSAKTAEQAALIRHALTDNFIFAGVGDEEINLLINAMGILEVNRGENIITEGDEGDFFYIISNGNFTVIKNNATVVTLGPGKSFGELALMSNTPRGATIRAETPGVLYSLDRDTFRFILASCSASRMAMITKALEKVPLLKGLTSEQFQKISDSVEVIKYAPDEYIIRKGTEGNIFYILQEGKVKITDIGTATQYGDHELEAGTFFGERALLTAEPRTANVIAATPVQVLALDRLSFDSILGPLRDIMDFNTTLMSVNNIGLLEHLDEKIRTRIVKALSSESYPAGYTIIKQGDIGDKLFIIREGSAKIIKDGVDMGLLAAGQFFGEGALIEDETRIASIYAETKCKVFTLDRATFMRIGGKSVRNSGSMKSVKGWMDKLDTGDSPKAKEDHKRPATSTGGSDKVTPMVKYNFTDLKEIGLLGTGSFGRVSLVQHLQEKKVYALKAMLKYQIVTNKQEKNVVQEKHVMAESDHPFILKLYSTFKDERYIYMLLEVIPGGELFSVIHTRKGDGVPDEHVKFYGCCIMQAIAYLHAKDIAYRDMKPENCLID
eukprot:gene5441-10920_t